MVFSIILIWKSQLSMDIGTIDIFYAKRIYFLFVNCITLVYIKLFMSTLDLVISQNIKPDLVINQSLENKCTLVVVDLIFLKSYVHYVIEII